MKHFLLLSLLLLTASAHAQYTQGLTLVWAEEFDRPGRPDPVFWGYEEGHIRNEEAQYYTRRPENVRVEDGCLVIEALREDVRREGGRILFSPARDINDLAFSIHDGDAGAETVGATAATTGNTKTPATSKDNSNASAATSNRASAATSRNPAPNPDAPLYKYTSGSINTLGRIEFFRGRIEVRAKLPAGRGTWPAIWTLGTDIESAGHPECGEIDIMEYVGMEPFNIYFNAHTPGSRSSGDPDLAGRRLVMRDATVGFHVFALEWSENELAFFVDGRKVHSYMKDASKPGFWRFDKPHYLLLNLAIGGAWGGQQGIDESLFPVKYYIDWVRYYK